MIAAAAAGDQIVRARIAAAMKDGDTVILPSIVIAETTRGGPGDARLNQVIKQSSEVVGLDEPTARRAGHLLAAARSDATIDAVIVATAERQGGGLVMTSDRTDMPGLAANATGVRLVFV